MTTLAKLEYLHSAILNDTKQLNDGCLVICKDKTLPLDTRWKAYEMLIASSEVSSDSIMRYSLCGVEYDAYEYTESSPFYYQKYQSIDNVEVINDLETNYSYDKEDIDELKDQMVSSGVRFWVLDW